MILGSTILVVLLFTLMASGIYTGLALAGVGVVGLDLMRHLGSTVGAVLYNSLNSFPLAALPMFVFMGFVILKTGLSDKLYTGISKWTRMLPGSLLYSNILSCAIFAAVCGSSPTTALTIGSVAIPEQGRRGYHLRIVTGSLAAGGTLGILIPPSINMIIYGAFVHASVGRLFIGGIVPGIILALMFMCCIAFLSMRDKSIAPPREKVTKQLIRDGVAAWKDILPVASIILLIMVSIYGGIMTPTEAAAGAAFLALVAGAVFGKISFNILKDATLDTLRISSLDILLYVGACMLGAALGLLRIPTAIANLVATSGLGPLQVWLAVVVMYLILGCLMDTLAMMMITLPVTFPLLVTVCGFDPIWFGVQLVILCEIGMVTPPVGLNLFLMQGIAKIDLQEVIRGVIPFLICLLGMLALCTFMPNLILFLPSQMMGG